MSRTLEVGLLPSILRWTARLISLVPVGFVLLFLFGREPLGHPEPRQWVGLLFFPLGVCAGLLLAWLREGTGAFVAAASLACFYLVYGILLGGAVRGPWFLILTSPALLFLGSWLLHRDRSGPRMASPSKP